jgi:DNA-binding response OmpR family regulator
MKHMFNIMVVEDDANTRRLMCTVLERYGYHAITATDGEDALEQLDKKHVDLIILDIMMPRMDGYEFTRILREGRNNLPILMVSAKQTPADKRRGFIIGTDDYMTKPVDEEEMILRIAALLRRSRIVSERRLTVGSTVLFYDAFSIRTDGDDSTAAGGMELPQKEFLLLFKLLSYPNKIFTRRQLMDEIWDMDSESDERTVDVHISRLRDRFRGNPDFDIITVRGLGYKAVYLK